MTVQVNTWTYRLKYDNERSRNFFKLQLYKEGRNLIETASLLIARFAQTEKLRYLLAISRQYVISIFKVNLNL